MLNPQKQLEQMGFPTVQPPKIYKQTYKESVIRFLPTVLIGIIHSVLSIPLPISIGVWFLGYSISVSLILLKKIPKEITLTEEVKFIFSYFVLFLVTYLVVYNGLTAFNDLK